MSYQKNILGYEYAYDHLLDKILMEEQKTQKEEKNDQIIQISDIEKHNQSISSFTFFAKNLQINEIPSLTSLKHFLSEISQFLSKVQKNQRIKVVRPLKTICLKLFEANTGINMIHIEFLRLILECRVYKEAIQILDRKQMIARNCVAMRGIYYLYLSAQIYVQLGNFRKANQIIFLLWRDLIVYVQQHQESFDIIMSIVLFSLSSSKQVIEKEEINTILVVMSQREQIKDRVMILKQIWESKKQIAEGRAKEMLRGSKRINQKLYRMIDKKARQMNRFVEKQRKQLYERIKIEEIEKQSLNAYKSMHKINRFSQNAKFDCKQKILYISHIRYTPAQINQMITQSHQIYKLIKSKRDYEQQSYWQHQNEGKFTKGLGGLGGMRWMV